MRKIGDISNVRITDAKTKSQKERESKNKGSYLKNYKQFAVRAAKDLCYSANIVKRIKDAKTEIEIQKIMREARIESFN